MRDLQGRRKNARGWGPRLLLSVGRGSWVRGETVRGTSRRWLCQGSWTLRWVEKLPRCTPGCGSGAANSPARSGAGAQRCLTRQTGCWFLTRSVCLVFGYSNLALSLAPPLSAFHSSFRN